MTVTDETLAYAGVLEPLFAAQPTWWEGITWANVLTDVIAHEVVIGRRSTGGTPVLIWRFPKAGVTLLQRERWDALRAWAAWAGDAAQAEGHAALPRSWYVAATYPSAHYKIPKRWLRDAHMLGTTWGDWKQITKLAHRGRLTLSDDLIAAGMTIKATEGPTAWIDRWASNAGSRRDGGLIAASNATRHADYPPAWQDAVTVLCQDATAATARGYRSMLRRILSTSGYTGGQPPDLGACAAAASSLGPNYRTLWRRFSLISVAHAKQIVVAASGALEPHGRAWKLDEYEEKLAEHYRETETRPETPPADVAS